LKKNPRTWEKKTRTLKKNPRTWEKKTRTLIFPKNALLPEKPQHEREKPARHQDDAARVFPKQTGEYQEPTGGV
jgi:hypothetical protein